MLSCSHNAAQCSMKRHTCRSLCNGMVVGTSEGFTKDLQLIGVGYRATVTGKQLNMNLGFSHPVQMEIPPDVEVKVSTALLVMHIALSGVSEPFATCLQVGQSTHASGLASSAHWAVYTSLSSVIQHLIVWL